MFEYLAQRLFIKINRISLVFQLSKNKCFNATQLSGVVTPLALSPLIPSSRNISPPHTHPS